MRPRTNGKKVSATEGTSWCMGKRDQPLSTIQPHARSVHTGSRTEAPSLAQLSLVLAKGKSLFARPSLRAWPDTCNADSQPAVVADGCCVYILCPGLCRVGDRGRPSVQWEPERQGPGIELNTKSEEWCRTLHLARCQWDSRLTASG